MYALNRKSHQCVGALLNYAITAEDIVSTMLQKELSELIVFSPSNLKEFFDKAFRVIEQGVPKFGLIDDEPVFLLNDNGVLSEEDLD